jgi:hypothetical protein
MLYIARSELLLCGQRLGRQLECCLWALRVISSEAEAVLPRVAHINVVFPTLNPVLAQSHTQNPNRCARPRASTLTQIAQIALIRRWLCRSGLHDEIVYHLLFPGAKIVGGSSCWGLLSEVSLGFLLFSACDSPSSL